MCISAALEVALSNVTASTAHLNNFRWVRWQLRGKGWGPWKWSLDFNQANFDRKPHRCLILILSNPDTITRTTAGTSPRMTGGHGSTFMRTTITRWQLFPHSLAVTCHSPGCHKSLQRRHYLPRRRTLADEPRCYCDTRSAVTTPLNKEVLIKGLTNWINRVKYFITVNYVVPSAALGH